jgi:hypothetical protein
MIPDTVEQHEEMATPEKPSFRERYERAARARGVDGAMRQTNRKPRSPKRKKRVDGKAASDAALSEAASRVIEHPALRKALPRPEVLTKVDCLKYLTKDVYGEVELTKEQRSSLKILLDQYRNEALPHGVDGLCAEAERAARSSQPHTVDDFLDDEEEEEEE